MKRTKIEGAASASDITIPPVPQAPYKLRSMPSADIRTVSHQLRGEITSGRFSPPDNATPLLRDRLEEGERYLARVADWLAAVAPAVERMEELLAERAVIVEPLEPERP